MDRNEQLFERAQKVIPGGVNSPVRAFRSVGGAPRFIERAKGPHMWDAEGKQYVDYVCSWGPMILGHNHPAVLEALHAAVERGISFGAATEAEIEIAEEIRKIVPSMEEVRLVSSGTEAGMSAIRLARGYTNRNKIIKFEGCYHGHSDALLVKAGSGLLTFGNPSSSGVPASVTEHTLVLEYNNPQQLEEAFAKYGDDIACVIVEAFAGNMNLVRGTQEFIDTMRRLCTKHGALLIVDEVMTGFRVALHGAQSLFNVTPDITMLGKVIGGGMPVAAFGGRADIMEKIAPKGAVYQAGTLSGNPLATAAGLATLRLADEGVYARVDSAAGTVAGIVHSALEAEGVPHSIQRAASLFSVAFGPAAATAPLRNYEEMQAQETWRHAPFFHAFLDAGVALPPSLFEAWFVSAAHGEKEFEAIAAAAPAAARAAARAVPSV